MTLVFFVLVTALQATEYGSLRISNTLSNADLAETTANASESVSNNASNILVKEGQQVSAGQKIAEMGDTDSNTVKLHFEIRQQGKSVDPAKFLASN